jgi:hypothetical protein
MSTEIERPWVPTELQPSKRHNDEAAQLRIAFREAWEINPENFQGKQTSADNDESTRLGLMGSVAFDKADVARLLSNHIRSAHPDWSTAALTPAAIARRIHWAADDAGVARNAIIAAKAEYKSVEAQPVDEPGPDSDGENESPENPES